jgi:Bacteriophage baseplate protein W
MRDFLGVGWAFPVGVDARGRIALARQERDIEEAIRIILLTPKGQRVMRPEFGCQIHDLMFAPNDATTAGLAAYYVEEALAMWEPRIHVTEVTARPDPENHARLLIDIAYEVKATHDSRSLVFPFYRIPGEA